MEADFILVVLLVSFPALLVGLDFLILLIKGKRAFGKWFIVIELVVVIIALIYLWLDTLESNSCCGSSAIFSPEHRLSIIVLVGLCLVAYFYSSYRRSIASPLVEILTNCLLLTGIVLNVFVSIQIRDWGVWLIGNVPVIMLFIQALVKNHRLALAAMEEPEDGGGGGEAPGQGGEDRGDEKSGGDLGDDKSGGGGGSRGTLELFCRGLLYLKPLYKFPILLVLCLPILVMLAGLLLLFGQKPDSLIRAFTDTYHHGLSQWDKQCEGVVCGGHFLCTIAAKGHGRIVRPIRSGVRGGRRIICNRQLLVSNAFEDLLEQRLPAVHRPIRKLYNRIGRRIHRHYGWFNRKWVSDSIYILMKPLEWFFLLALYTFDRRPEDRIAQQYLERSDRGKIAAGLSIRK